MHEDSASGGADGEKGAAAPLAPPPGGIVDTLPGSGWTEGTLSVNHNGAAEYHLPLWVPDGRGGLQPELALHYNSQGGNGLVGVGWSLSAGLSSITPCSRTWAQDGRSDNPNFLLTNAYCLDGQRLRPTDAEWSPEQDYRTERETFARIRAYSVDGDDRPPSQFKVWTKDGRILTFDAVRATGLYGAGFPDDDTEFSTYHEPLTAAWALTTIEDRNGNEITIEYDQIVANRDNLWALDMVPERITYDPDRTIEFAYEERSDNVDRFQAGTDEPGSMHWTFARRLVAVRMSDATALLREYRLLYGNDNITGRSQLRSVTECDGGDPVEGDPPVCMNALEFEWTESRVSFERVDTDITDLARAAREKRYPIPGDINGDGLDDLIYRDHENNWKMRFSTGDGFTDPQDAGIQRVNEDYHPRVRPIDFDRDGRTDLMVEVPVNDTTQFSLYRSTGSAYQHVFTDPQTFNRIVGPVREGGLWAGYFVDIDGNGLPDYFGPRLEHVIDAEPDEPDNRFVWTHRLNLESGFGPYIDGEGSPGPLEAWTENVPFDHQIRGVAASGARARLLMWSASPSEAEFGYWSIYLDANGELDHSVFGFNLPFLREPENRDRRNLHFADINGDGLEDAVYPCTGLKVQLASGTGFSRLLDGPPDDEIDDCPVVADDNLRVRVVDFTGDGADDILLIHVGDPKGTGDHSRGIQLYTWTGRGFDRHGTSIPPNPDWGGPLGAVQPLDFNGDGLMDLAQVWSTSPDTTTSFLRLHKRVGDIPEKLIRIKVAGLGVRAEVDYTTLANASVHTRGVSNCSYPLTCPTRGGSIVSAHRLANGVDPDAPWREFTHHYWAARADLRGRGWLGFEQHDVRDLERGDALARVQFDNHTEQQFPDGNGFTMSVYPFAGQPHKISYSVTSGSRDGSPVFYERTTDRELRFHLGDQPGTWLTRLDSVTVSEREKVGPGGEWTALHSRATAFQYDEFENIRQVTTASPGSDQVDVIDYDQDFDNWLLRLPRTHTPTSCTRPDNECQTRHFSFDTYENGNLKETVVEPEDEELLLRTSYIYGNFGNVSSVTVADAAGETRTTGLTYDTLDLYPRTTTNALEQTSSVTVHTGLGVVLDSRDANGIIPATMKYDRFGRLREVNQADGYFERHSTFGPRAHLVTVPDGGGGTITARTVVLDELGRPIDRSIPAFGDGTSTVRTAYDRLGRILTVSRPFLSGSQGPLDNATFQYDGLDRPLSIVEPDGATTRHEYVGLEKHTHDAEGNHSYVLERPDGQIDSRYEDDPESSNWLTTRFEYDPFQLLRKMTSPDLTSQTMEYDRLGRRTGHVDPSSGTTTSTYNAFGELDEEIDGNGAVTDYVYDALGRLRQVNSPDGLAVHNWDTSPNGIGKPASSRSAEGVGISYFYDPIGRPSSTRWNIEGTAYELTYGYDDIGRPAGVTYPVLPGAPQTAGRLAIQYRYNAQGYLDQVSDVDASRPDYWTADDRNVAGQLLRERLGNNVVNEYTYEATTGLLRTSESTGPGQIGLLASLSYVYDLNRNVIDRTDVFNGRTDAYAYDELDRLTQWTASNGTTQLTATYDYDSIGNLRTETVQGVPNQSATYTYGQNGAPPHALSSRNTITYGYDSAGRQTSGPNRTIEFNSWNLPKLLTWGIGEGGPWETEFLYDAQGTRVLKRDDHQTKLYVGGLFERRVPAPSQGTEIHNLHNVVVEGRVVAQIDRVQRLDGQITNTPVSYLHSDVQGSTTLVTNSAGRAIPGFLAQLFYDPWGRRIEPGYTPYADERHGGPHEGYTGHEHEDEIGLVNMRGRIYEPKTRRFLTPDPFVQAPLFSQSHNRYSYVWNNPATFTDPTGFECIENPGECGDDDWIGIDPEIVIDGVGDAVNAIGDGIDYLFGGGGGPEPARGPSSADNYATDISSIGSHGGYHDPWRGNPAVSGGRHDGPFGGGRFRGSGAGGDFGELDPEVVDFLTVGEDYQGHRYDETVKRAAADPEYRAFIRRSNSLSRPDSFDRELGVMADLLGRPKAGTGAPSLPAYTGGKASGRAPNRRR